MRYIVAIIVFSLCHIAAWGQLAPEKAEELRLKAELEYFSVESVRRITILKLSKN